MKTKKYTVAILAAILAFSCKEAHDAKLPEPELAEKTYSELAKADWFLGRWENNSSEGNLSETWQKENDSTFQGASYFVIGKDTVFAESVKLWQKGNQLIYEVTVPGQNGSRPVEFAMTSSNGKQIVFENPQHDFPNKITYTKVANDSLVAEISGNKNGKPSSETFRMKKK